MEDHDRQWQQLEGLVAQIERRGLRSLSTEQLVQFGRAYRRAASALSQARTRGLGGASTDQLNRLVARAYGQVYVTPARRRGSFRQFVLAEFPATFRRQIRFIAVAFALFASGGLLGGVLTTYNASMPDLLLGPGWADELENLADRHVGLRNWLPEETRPLASTAIMTNNIKVGFLSFAGGMFAGLLTVYVMWFNGLMIGTVAAVVHRRGVDLGFWSFVAPHGVIELTAIFIAGGAGLMLGYALINPGPYTRGTALKLAAREAIKLVMGVVLLLIPAGLIEAFLSPAVEVPAAFKLLFAAVVGTFLYAYLFLCGLSRSAVSTQHSALRFRIPESGLIADR
jgi:uncharacterized membrane protein SpoIIM required for sporulation